MGRPEGLPSSRDGISTAFYVSGAPRAGRWVVQTSGPSKLDTGSGTNSHFTFCSPKFLISQLLAGAVLFPESLG